MSICENIHNSIFDIYTHIKWFFDIAWDTHTHRHTDTQTHGYYNRPPAPAFVDCSPQRWLCPHWDCSSRRCPASLSHKPDWQVLHLAALLDVGLWLDCLLMVWRNATFREIMLGLVRDVHIHMLHVWNIYKHLGHSEGECRQISIHGASGI